MHTTPFSCTTRSSGPQGASSSLVLTGLGLLLLLGGCASPGGGSGGIAQVPPDPTVLRVGITANMPPMIFGAHGNYQGIEADLAQRLATHLGRRLVFVEVPWERQIDALVEGRTDIIMSSMTMTEPRRFRINFSKPYMSSGQAALVRRDEASKLELFLFNDPLKTGVQEGTTGDFFVQQYMPRARRVVLGDAATGAERVASKKLDVLIHDAPVVWWWASKYESRGLSVLQRMLTQELLGWGVRKGDEALLNQVNAFIDTSTSDGSLRAIVGRWLPQFPGQ